MGPKAKASRARAGSSDRVAVLPFRNLGTRPRFDYLADGITEELIAALSRVTGLSVIARTSAMHYQRSTKTIAEIARELSVGWVVEGSVRRAGRTVRILVRLIDARTEEERWSGSYERAPQEVYSIQREIALAVGRALRGRRIKGAFPESPTDGIPEANAHDLYLQGRFQWNLRTEAGLKLAIGLFQRAIEKDRTFALAYVGMADAWAQLGWLEYLPPTEAFPKAREAAERALAIDDRLPEAHASLGFVSFLYERDWATAQAELQKAIALNPGYPTGHQFYADYLKAMGRFDEALAEMRSALTLDPVSMALHTGLGHVLYLARQYDAAIAQYTVATKLDPAFGPAHLWFGRPYLQKGMYDQAIAEIQLAVASSRGSTMARAVLAHALASAGRSAEARALLRELVARPANGYLPSYWVALVYTGLGEVDTAIEWLERAAEERSSWLVWIKVEPRFDPLRSHPRFTVLLQRMRLEATPGPPAPRRAASRRLAAIMFTDVVGFTRLAQRDEARALRLLEEHRAILRPLFAARGGREIKSLGDGFVVEFPSAVESVRCAVEIQAAVEKRNAARRRADRFLLRVGVHVGDVVSEGDDLVGDGVNVASRIEPLARPGGICITGAVWDQVIRKVDIRVEPLRDVALKNVSAPVTVYAILGGAHRRAPPDPL